MEYKDEKDLERIIQWWDVPAFIRKEEERRTEELLDMLIPIRRYGQKHRTQSKSVRTSQGSN